MLIKWVIIIILLISGFLVMNYSVTADPQKVYLQDEADSSLQEISVIPPSPLSLKEAVILGETISEEWPA